MRQGATVAVEWYYLENDAEHGPVSGKQLKALAAAGSVFPWTPLRRVSGSDQSPWTRAGAIQGLFSEKNVADQLGGPICDDCGTLLDSDGACPKCNPLGDAAANEETTEIPFTPATTPPTADKIEDESSLGDFLLFGLGVLLIVGAFFYAFAVSSEPYQGSRFQSDNAVGATANALESIAVGIGFWGTVLAGIGVLIYLKLRQIRRNLYG